MEVKIIRKTTEFSYIEEIHYVSEIKETPDCIILKRLINEEIIEINKTALFYYNIQGLLIKK